MSKIPLLRTSELWEASNKPRVSEGNRQSRSTNIVRSNSSTNLRNGSVDRSSINSKPYISNSAIKPRSQSVNATPRTPNHQIPVGNFLSTAEKAETYNKKWIQTESISILEYLKLHAPKFDSKFFQKNNPLKTMSTKQFVQILNIFLEKLGPLRATTDPDNIVKILNDIGYPHAVTKSWLKTPCAPHAHIYVIQLFSFLRSLVDESVDDFVEENFQVSKLAIDAFTAWNNFNTKEYDQIKEQLRNEYLQKHYQIESAKALDDEILLLDMEIKELEQRKPVTNRQEELLKIEKDFNKLEKNILKLENIGKLDEKKLTELKLRKATQIQLVEDMEKNIVELKEKIKVQKMSSEEYFKLTEEINQLIMEMEIYNKKNTEVQNSIYKNQVSESRLVQQKMELVIKYNGILSNISTYLETENHNNLHIGKDAGSSHLEELKKFWSDFNLNLKSENSLKEEEVKLLAHKLDLLEHQLKISNQNLKEIIEQIDNQQELLFKQEKELLNVRNLDAKNLNDKIDKINALKLIIVERKKDIADKGEFLKRFEKENEDNWKEIKEKAEKTLEIRNKELKKVDEAVDRLQDNLEKLMEMTKDVLDN